MPKTEIDLNPVDFITIGTIGPRGKRIFHLQAGHDERLIDFVIEKEQAWALGDAIRDFLDDVDERTQEDTEVEMAAMDMELREPIQPLFRVAQMGLAYEEAINMVILTALEMLNVSETEEGEDNEDPSIVRMWCTRQQMRALSLQALDVVSAGRPSPKQNGRITYYWT
jgi:uncharacterized repeat protein (TIGR03847 family)